MFRLRNKKKIIFSYALLPVGQIVQSMNFYENNMISLDPAKTVLKVMHGLMDTITRTKSSGKTTFAK